MSLLILVILVLQQHETDLEAIAGTKSVRIITDNYDDFSMACWVWDKPDFFIHLNTARGNTQ